MDLPETLTLESLLCEFGVDKEEAFIIRQGIESRDVSVLDRLRSAVPTCDRIYQELLIANPDGVSGFYAWLNIAIGDALRLQSVEDAHQHFFRAWRAFLRTKDRELEEKAHILALQFPKLTTFPEVTEYYRTNPEIAKRYNIVH